MNLGTRRKRLESAGLIVLEDAWPGETRPVLDAWAPVIRFGIEPDARVVATETGDYLAEVDRQWERIAQEAGVFSESGDFLICVADEGSAGLPWARVRRGPTLALADQLAPVAGEPEFISMALDSSAVCGVTTEEYEVWIVSGALPPQDSP
jgi:hypothetical protein